MLPHEEWLQKARHDIASARLLAAATPAILDAAIYHTQQCAEKALKAYLAFLGRPIEKIHNVRILAERCAEAAPVFAAIVDDAVFLTPFDTLYRYPDEVLDPEPQDVAKAIACAEKIIALVEQQTS